MLEELVYASILQKYPNMENPSSNATQSYIRCRNCWKDIAVFKYRIHMWKCAGVVQINPTIANMFRKEMMMSKNLDQLMKLENKTEEVKFTCTQCCELLTQHQIQTHPAQCKRLPIECEYCLNKYPRQLFQVHEQGCERRREKQQKKALQSLVMTQIVVPATTPTLDPIIDEEPTVQDHISYLFRDLAKMMGEKNPLGLTNGQLKDLPQQVFKKTAQLNQEVCAICDIDLVQNQKLVRLHCSHWFHRDCICGWLARNSICLTCRSQVKKQGKK